MKKNERAGDTRSLDPGCEALERWGGITCYLVEKDPADWEGWRAYERQHPHEARSLGVLLLHQLAEDERELRKVLASLPPDCGFTVTLLDRLQEGERCRGEKRGNTITICGAGPLADSVRRIAPEPGCSRLIQHWNAQYLAQIGPLNTLSGQIVELSKAEPLPVDALFGAHEGFARTLGIQHAYEQAISALVSLPTFQAPDLQRLLATLAALQIEAATPLPTRGGDELEGLRAYLGSQVRQGEYAAYADLRADVNLLLAGGWLDRQQQGE